MGQASKYRKVRLGCAGVNVERDEIGIMIFPHVESCRKLAAALPPQATQAEIVRDAAVQAYFAGLVKRLSADSTGSASRIARAVVLGEPISIDLGEVTDKGSLNQRALLKTRAAVVEEPYAQNPAMQVIVV